MKRYKLLSCAACMAGVLSLASIQADDQTAGKDGWIQLFNGKNLNGWTPKFKGYDLGVNYKNTFLVKDGLLTVSYKNYDQWKSNFGHLFYKEEFSHYILRAEYRFIGDQVAKGPGWAFRNNGLMIHGQTAASMKKNQDFPNSIEVQLLGGDPGGKGERSTLNLCTPGTHVYYNGKLDKRHCISSTSPTFHGDQWVEVEVEVHGSEVIRHKIDGKVVLEYKMPQLNDGTLLEKGTISIQAESHPTQFRKIELKVIRK
ncbi:MAG: DUF1080 domain-containing protein [Verrucomicrobiae bacterium]|nr:DUF1080 domain-containing protein [Verrucomicrobiae bacterium]NNJ87652.1 DUF1080 domain-containing protein [Akkermansiaceae bacterium]